MKRLLTLAVLCACAAFAQIDGPIVSPTTGPPPIGYTSLLFYDGSGNLQYVCQARSTQPTQKVTITNVVVLTNVGTVNATAHGLQVGNQITLAGSATAALNGAYLIATAATNSFTISTAKVGDATYTDATMTTVAPRSSAANWAVQKLTYTTAGGSTVLAMTQWSRGNTAMGAICDNRATLTYQ